MAVVHFGDLCRAGVISEPEFCFVDLASDDETLILASDGVFEFMSDEEVVDIVCNGNASNAEEACSQVRQTGSQRTGYCRYRCLCPSFQLPVPVGTFAVLCAHEAFYPCPR